MIRDWIRNKKKWILFGVAAMTAATCLVMTAGAKEDSFVIWSSTSKKNEVAVSLRMQDDEELEDVVTFQVKFKLEGESIEHVEFVFDSGLKNKDIPVKKAFYNNGILSVYVSGRDTVLERSAFKLGKIKVESEKDVTITYVEDSGLTVDRFHTSGRILQLGNTESYTMKLSVEDSDPADPPKESSEENTDPPENPSDTPSVTPPETPEKPTNTPSEEPEEPETETSRSHSSSGSASSGTPGQWKKNGDSWTFVKPDGTRVKSEWVEANGIWYWIDENGQMKTGWIDNQGTWYYCDPSGAMKTGWVNVQGTWYYCNTNGAMKTGWIMDRTCWYYLNDNGSMRTGWMEKEGKWYYLGSDGKMVTDDVTPDGYRVDKNGVWVK